jgi:hypothetical protein
MAQYRRNGATASLVERHVERRALDVGDRRPLEWDVERRTWLQRCMVQVACCMFYVAPCNGMPHATPGSKGGSSRGARCVCVLGGGGGGLQLGIVGTGALSGVNFELCARERDFERAEERRERAALAISSHAGCACKTQLALHVEASACARACAEAVRECSRRGKAPRVRAVTAALVPARVAAALCGRDLLPSQPLVQHAPYDVCIDRSV